MDTLETIKARRSIRRYKPDPVDDKILTQVLEAARWAPSWSNTQCSRFIVVKDPATKAALAGILASDNPAAKAFLSAPIIIVACAELKKSGFYSGTDQPCTNKGDWFMFDVALAMENLALAAHTFGLGTVHVGLFDAAKAESILGIPGGFTVVEMTPLGYRDTEGCAPPRKELAEIVFKEKFGVKYEFPPA
jgi:nitroreductase